MQDDTANQTQTSTSLGSTLPPQENSNPTISPIPSFEPVMTPALPTTPIVETVPTVLPTPEPAVPDATQDNGGGFPQVLDGSETPPPPPVINGGTTPTTPTFVPEKSGGKGRGKIIATIFGILLLVGGVGAGLVLTQQTQIFKPRAACETKNYNECCGPGLSRAVAQTCDSAGVNHWTTGACNQNDSACGAPAGTSTPGCQPGWQWNGSQCVCVAPDNCGQAPAPTAPPSGTTPPGTGGGASCYDGAVDQTLKCQTYAYGKGCTQDCVGCVKCNNGSYIDVEDTTAGCPTQCYTGSLAPGEPAPSTPPTEDQYGTACQNGCCNLSTNGIPNFPACAHNCWVVAYKCPGASAGIPCNSNGTVGDGQCFQANYCGSQQIDVRCSSYDNTGDCAGLAPSSAISVVSIINPGVCEATPTPPGGTNPPGDNPTPTPPGPNAQCLEVLAFDTDWNQLTPAQLSALTAGDIVRFTARGSASSGTFDRARFTINTVLGPEVTGIKPTTGEFYYEYTIPSGVTTFTIKGEIHHISLGWR